MTISEKIEAAEKKKYSEQYQEAAQIEQQKYLSSQFQNSASAKDSNLYLYAAIAVVLGVVAFVKFRANGNR